MCQTRFQNRIKEISVHQYTGIHNTALVDQPPTELSTLGVSSITNEKCSFVTKYRTTNVLRC